MPCTLCWEKFVSPEDDSEIDTWSDAEYSAGEEFDEESDDELMRKILLRSLIRVILRMIHTSFSRGRLPITSVPE